MRQALPYLERLVLVARRFCEDGDSAEQESPCSTCTKEHLDCDKACEHLKRLLPKEYGGKMHKEGTIDLDLDLLRDTSSSSGDGYDEERDVKRDRSKLNNIQKVQSPAAGRPHRPINGPQHRPSHRYAITIEI